MTWRALAHQGLTQLSLRGGGEDKQIDRENYGRSPSNNIDEQEDRYLT